MLLEVVEQPAKLHRFRYSKEVNSNRMGSILHSRSSAKVPVKIRVTNNGSTTESTAVPMKLIGCTVFEDLAPHPFYLFGDGCSNGVFEQELKFSQGSTQEVFSLERIGIVCTPKKKSSKVNESGKDESHFKQREHLYNFFKITPKKDPLRGKEVNKLRLAFQVLVQNPNSNEWTPAADCKPVATDVIWDAKIYSKLTVDSVYPKEVLQVHQDIWLYMKDPLPAEVANRYRVTLEFEGGASIELPASKVKKHLVVFNMTGKTLPMRDGNVSVTVTDVDTGDVSEPVNFCLNLPQEPASKKIRSQNPTTIESLDDLLETFTNGFEGDNTYNMHDVEPNWQKSTTTTGQVLFAQHL